MMELGLTWPLQRLLKTSVPYSTEPDRFRCWDAHCITLRGWSSLLLVHCASRWTCVRYDMSLWDWAALPDLAQEEIRMGLREAGIPENSVNAYLAENDQLISTRTHGRREVAFLNRAWEDVLAADWLIDPDSHHQPLLNSAVNDRPCRCAGFDGVDTARVFLIRCFQKQGEPVL